MGLFSEWKRKRDTKESEKQRIKGEAAQSELEKQQKKEEAQRYYQSWYDDFVADYKKSYDKIKTENNFPTSDKFESITVNQCHYYIWSDGNRFNMLEHKHFFPALSSSFIFSHPEIVNTYDFSLDFSKLDIKPPRRLSVPLAEVKKFYTAGSATTKTELIGGEPTFNTGDAIIGGAIAGPVGALLAGQSITPYKIKEATTDNRKVFLKIGDETLELDFNNLEALKKVIPEKFVK